MSRKHKLIFVALSLFPFVLAMGFRAADNYQFALERHHHIKTHPDYFPSIKNAEELQLQQEFTCQHLKLAGDSTNVMEPLSE